MMNLFAATRAVSFATKLFAAADLSFDKIVSAADENALKAHIEQAVAAAPAKTTLTEDEIRVAVTGALRAELTKAGIELATEDDAMKCIAAIAADNKALYAALTTAGVSAESPEQVSAALDQRIALRASEELAKRGLKDFPEQIVAEDPAKSKAGGVLVKSYAEFSALSPQEKMKFSKAGGRIES